jgi:hypothetical protein
MISRPNDQLNRLSTRKPESCRRQRHRIVSFISLPPFSFVFIAIPSRPHGSSLEFQLRFSNTRGFFLAMEPEPQSTDPLRRSHHWQRWFAWRPVFVSDTQNLSHQWPLQNRLRFVSRCTLKYQLFCIRGRLHDWVFLPCAFWTSRHKCGVAESLLPSRQGRRPSAIRVPASVIEFLAFLNLAVPDFERRALG